MTRDSLFDGALVCCQHRAGYRFSLDAVLAAQFARPGSKARVLDLGCGSGVIGLIVCYRWQHRLARVCGLEIQPQLAALALIKRAEAFRTELHYRPDSLDLQALKHQITQARQCYEQALEKASDNPTLIGLAKYGLALCDEESGNLEAAEGIYREIVDNPVFEGTIVRVQARQRLDTIDDYKEKIFFT